jgi:glycerate kinase
MHPKKILLVPDSFKGCLTAIEAGHALCQGLQNFNYRLKCMPISDGGDGATDVINAHLNLEKIEVYVHNAYGAPIAANYLKHEKTAYAEVAEASGFRTIDKDNLDPLLASSYGTGEILLDAIASGCTTIYLFLGGSVTVDGGSGLAKALGLELVNDEDQTIDASGNPLMKLASLKTGQMHESLCGVRIYLITDVQNPAIGAEGAARVFGPQKGATESMIELLDKRMTKWGMALEKISGKTLLTASGMGAAGGIGLPLMAFGDTQVENGAEWFIQLLEIEQWIQWADHVIVAEGCIDEQSFMGKITGRLLSLARMHKKKVTGICGITKGDVADRFDQLWSLVDDLGVEAEFACQNSARLLSSLMRKKGKDLYNI